MVQNNVQAFLSEHPRMIGVLFTVGLALMQAGSVIAANANTTNGP
ncbi:DUF7503 family protein [Halomicrococcus sp. NG-SE-24]